MQSLATFLHLNFLLSTLIMSTEVYLFLTKGSSLLVLSTLKPISIKEIHYVR
jgi:hypothetical protein